MMRKVLIGQSDREASSRVAQLLSVEGFECTVVETGNEIELKLQQEDDWDLIVLDSILPDMEGDQICQSVREVTITPVLVLSSSDEDDVVIRILNSGADEFILKPVSGEVFLARAFALLRRSSRMTSNKMVGRIQHGNMVVDLDRVEVSIGDQLVTLTPSEFRLLTILASNPGRVLSARSLVKEVQGYDCAPKEAQDLIKVHVHNLRRKVKHGWNSPFQILNIRGAGYMFERCRRMRSKTVNVVLT
ncbi:MAG: response regulator transcription factor [Chloroflexi bacterium]|nr:response regulator transcription factor [Chloroflexota bacterium]